MTRSAALRYALAPACIALAALLHLSPAGPFLHPTGLFVFAVIAAAWFGGAGPGFLGAALATLALPQLIPMSYPLVAGFFDLPRSITFAVTGLAVGWAATRRRRAEAALREARSDLETKVAERTRALQTSEERYALAMEASEEAHWDWIIPTDEYYAARSHFHIYGLPPDFEYSGRAQFLAAAPFHPEDRARYAEAVKRLFAGSESRLTMDMRLMLGETRWVQIRGLCTRDASGVPVRYTGTVKDITERKRLEPALAESEERYARAMEATEAGHWEWDLVTHQVFHSPRFRELYGVSPEEKFAHREAWKARQPVSRAERERQEQALQAAIADPTKSYDIELSFEVRPGEIRWLRSRGKVFRAEDGRPLRVTGATTDITARKLAEEALRVSEERYSLAMDASDEGHFDTDLVTDELFISERLNEIYGFAPGTRFASRSDYFKHFQFYAGDGEVYRAAIEAAEAKGAPQRYEFEYRIVLPSGEVRWLSTRGKVSRDAEGRAVRRTGVVTDITQRKRAEEALQLSEERYALAMQASREGHWDWKIASDEFYASPRWREISGFAPEEKLGRAEALARYPFHPEDRPKYEAAVAAHFAGATPRLDMELRVKPPGGLRWVKFTGMCLRDAAGTPVRWAGSIMDITEQKRAEQALRLSEERYERAMEGSDAGHWDWNIVTDEMFVSERAREMLALPPGPLPAHRSDIMARVPQHPDDRGAMPERISAGIRSGIHERDYRVIPRPGELRWLRSRGKVYKDARGAAVRMTGSLTDITERKRAADELGESEARFRSLTELSSDWYWRQDENLRFTYMSDQAAALGGFSAESSRGKLRWELPGITPLSCSWAEHQAALAARRPFRDFEMCRQMPDGSLAYYTISGAPIFDEQGRFKGYQGIGRSITERKRMEAELRQSETRFRALTELSSDWYWRQDENLRFTYVSHQVADSAEYPREWVIGKTRWELPGITLLSSSWAEHQALLAARQPFRDLEYARVGREGRKEYVSVSGAPIFDAQGVFRGYQGIGHNITERKRIEEELRARQEMLELAQSSARAVAFDWRAEREERWPAELEAMYGVAPGTWPGSFRPFDLERQEWRKLVHPDDWPALTEAIKHAHRTGEVVAEYRVIHADGSEHWLQSKGRMYFDAEKNPARMVGLIQDVTQLRHAEEELRAMERKLRQAQRLEAMGTLAGGIAHDFNNILGAILGYGEMALRDAAKGSRLARDLDSIIVAGERGRALVDRVLAFSRSGVGERVAVHVEKVVREALDLLSAKLPPNVTLHAKLHTGPAALLGDATQVHQVLMNLATNAIQAMPSGGTLRVSLDPVRLEAARAPTIGSLAPGEYLVLQVADTGTGIAPQIVDRIFDPFFTTKEVGTGTGLGLSLVHGIVAELGGAVDVASTVGAGSTFTVYLPRSGDALDSSEKQEPELPRGGGQRVLVVDDEEPLVKLATRTLEELGYAPTGFTSSVAALAAFRADPQRFDALITDERMPGMSGSALIREVRGIRDRIPIVLMSGYVGGAVASRAREAGAEEVLKKPLSARDLAASLARVLHP